MREALGIALYVFAALFTCGLVPFGMAVPMAELHRTKVILSALIAVVLVIVAVLAGAGWELT